MLAGYCVVGYGGDGQEGKGSWTGDRQIRRDGCRSLVLMRSECVYMLLDETSIVIWGM